MNTLLLIILSVVLLGIIIGIVVYFVNKEGYDKLNNTKNEIHVFTTAQNEEKYIVEWVVYNLEILGVDKIWIFSNNDPEFFNSPEYFKLKNYYNNKFQVIKYDIPYSKAQRKSCEYMIEKLKNKSAWLINIDIDEFINIPNDITLQNYLDNLDDNKKNIQIKQRIFQPKENTFVCEMDKYVSSEKDWVAEKLSDLINKKWPSLIKQKSIIHNSILHKNSKWIHTLNTDEIHKYVPPENELCIHHYMIRDPKQIYKYNRIKQGISEKEFRLTLYDDLMGSEVYQTNDIYKYLPIIKNISYDIYSNHNII